jgi:hypothetical protein
LRVRGEEKKDEEVHRIISWTTKKSCPLWAGISLPARYKVGDEFHEMQLWEETPYDIIIVERHAEVVYNWLMARLRGRSSEGMLPLDMPLLIEGATVQTWKDGRRGYILFTPRDSLTVPVGVMEVQVIIEYDQGYTRVGIGNAYTMNMLADEFLTVTQDQWKIYPLNGYRRLKDGTVVHRVTGDRDIFRAAAADHELPVLPRRFWKSEAEAH